MKVRILPLVPCLYILKQSKISNIGHSSIRTDRDSYQHQPDPER
jgi:hypothetical protein